MKKLLMLLLVFAAVPASAQEQFCWPQGGYCQYVADDSFSESPGPWSYSLGASRQSVFDPCAWGGGTTYAAKLPPGGSVHQDFTTTNWPYWSLELDIYFGSAGGASSDGIWVYVENWTLGYTEGFAFDATQYDTCGLVYKKLTKNHSNSSVRVLVARGSSASSTMSIAVDNVMLWGSQYP